MKQLPIKIIAKEKELIPSYATDGAAGADLKAAIEKPIDLQPGESCTVPTGIFLEIPKGFEAQIRSRSGLAKNHQVAVLNSPGTIDSDYRGELQVILINHGKTVFHIVPKMRIAQLVVSYVLRAEFESSDALLATERGTSGFGHTGVL